MAPGQVPALPGVNMLQQPPGLPRLCWCCRLPSLGFCSAKPRSNLAASVLSWAGIQPCSPHPGVPPPAPGIPP